MLGMAQRLSGKVAIVTGALQRLTMASCSKGQSDSGLRHAGHLHTRCAVRPTAGAAKGIGYACAQSLGREGAKVVVADIDAARARTAADTLGEQNIVASPFTCDVGSKPDVRPPHSAKRARFLSGQLHTDVWLPQPVCRRPDRNKQRKHLTACRTNDADVRMLTSVNRMLSPHQHVELYRLHAAGLTPTSARLLDHHRALVSTLLRQKH